MSRHNSTSRFFTHDDISDAHDRECERILEACEFNELPFSPAQISNAAWKRVGERLHIVVARRYTDYLRRTLPAYVRFDEWEMMACSDFLRGSRVEAVPGQQHQYRLILQMKKVM